MPRDRFLNLLHCFHFNTVSDETQTGELIQKIKPIVDYFNKKMLEICYPQKELSINEAMILWHGRLFFC